MIERCAMTECGGAQAAVLDCAGLLGDDVVAAMRRGRDFLRANDSAALLRLVGTTVPELALCCAPADKRFFPASYGRGKPCGDDLLAGEGCFYVTQDGKVMLDCTSGHYQMTWGYNQPALTALVQEGSELGVVWDNHANTPAIPVKLLTERLAGIAAEIGMDCVLLGVCTGSVACAAALKIMLARYWRDDARVRLGKPAIIVLSGNYHGTDVAAQALRGMWPGLVTGMEVVEVEPNDRDGLAAAFARLGRRAAGFWAEPIMMNREAIRVEPEYLQLAQALCAEHGALMAIDEIQTGFWYPEVLLSLRFGIRPDLLIVGKGMTAGFHPLAALLYRTELDILEQYDAISTNGNATLASLVALANLDLIQRDRDRLQVLAERLMAGFQCLAHEFPAIIEGVNGEGLLAGIKFRSSEEALGFHRAAVDRGLWVRVHAYHPGHRTVLTKMALSADVEIVEYLIEAMRALLTSTPWR